MTDNPITKMAEVLDKYGWIQGGYGSREEGFCLAGARVEALQGSLSYRNYSSQGIRNMRNQATCMLLKAICEVDVIPASRSDGVSIAAWNDDPHRTVEDVQLVLKRAAQLYEELT